MRDTYSISTAWLINRDPVVSLFSKVSMSCPFFALRANTPLRREQPLGSTGLGGGGFDTRTKQTSSTCRCRLHRWIDGTVNFVEVHFRIVSATFVRLGFTTRSCAAPLKLTLIYRSTQKSLNNTSNSRQTTKPHDEHQHTCLKTR